MDSGGTGERGTGVGRWAGCQGIGVDWAASDTKGFRGHGAPSLLWMPSVKGCAVCYGFNSNSSEFYDCASIFYSIAIHLSSTLHPLVLINI